MSEVIYLVALLGGEPSLEAVYIGQTALVTCMATAETYEVDAYCETPPSEVLPYVLPLGRVSGDVRPKKRGS